MTEVPETLGQRLRAEREHKGLSAQKAADELHLDGWVVEGLEADDYTRIGPSVYVRGHLKRYAEFLGLPAAEILARHSSPGPAALTVDSSHVGLSTDPATNVQWPRIAAMAGAVMIAALVWWWKPWHPRQAVRPVAHAAVPKPSDTAAPPAAAVPDENSDTVGGTAGRDTAIAVPPPNVAAPAAAGTNRVATAAAPTLGAGASTSRAEAEPGAGRARLRLSFSADSWVDVRDALGQRVYAGNGRANSVKTLAGNAPLRVYLGSANGVQLEINHHAVAIAPQYVVGKAAHFEAGADGVLRRDPHPGVSRPHG